MLKTKSNEITDTHQAPCEAPETAEALRRSMWQAWLRSLLLFCCASVYVELCLHLCVYRSLDRRAVYLVLFGLLGGTVCALLTTHLPKIARQIVGVLLVAVQVLFAEVQLMYHAIFGNFMPISQVSMGGNVITNFDSQILYSIGKNIVPILLLLVPLIVTILCLALRKLRVLTVRLKWRQALATLGMVAAAFNTWTSDAKYWVNGDVGREDSLDAAYTKLGFGDVKYRYYDVDVGKAGDFVGWSTARKTITLNGKRTTIVALILRGGGYGGEWVSNLHTGTGHAHSGFIIPVHEVFADLKNYLAAAQQKGGLGVVKLWMGGYSRGAAVANLLAARVNKELPGLERENVFVYTFATPVALGPQDYPDLQQDYDNNHNADGSLKESWGESNIFNIISSGDIVPHLLPEEWSFHRNGNDRFLPSTWNEEELEDLNEMGKNDFGPTPLDFSWLATDKETNEVMLSMEEYFISRENYHEKYEAALMDMIQCAFIRSEKEVTQNKVLDDGEVIQRLRTLTHLKNMDYWKISRAVWAASTMSRAVLKRVDVENIPIRAQQIVVPILAVGLCYGLESEAVSLIAKYILMFVAMKSAPDDAIRAAFCHHCENYIALMEYYAPSEHCMEATTRT